MSEKELEIKRILKEKQGKHIRLISKGSISVRDQCGIVFQIREDDFKFKIFGSTKKQTIEYKNVLKIMNP